MAIIPTGKQHAAGVTQAPTCLKWAQRLVLWLALAASLPALATLSATVDRTLISDADLLVLNVRLENSNSSVGPDFDVLENDFEIISNSGPQRTSRTSIVNGRRNSEVYVQWQFTLRAKRLGNLVVPALVAGNERSAPITVNVTRQSADMQRRTSQYVFFDTEVDVNEAYVQGQVLYTIKLFYIETISGDFPGAPVLPDAVVETLEGEKRYDSIINNRRYYVLEKRYGIYPQKSGKLVIPRETFAGTRGRSSIFASGDRVMAISNPITLNIKPKPASYPNANWLPAKALTITEVWGQTPPTFKVGEPINRTLTLKVEGVAASLLPPLDNVEIDGAKTYVDPPTINEVATNTGIMATQVYTIGIVPTRPGPMTLPAIRMPWWNTNTNKLEIAEIAATTINVAPNAAATVASPSLAPTRQPPVAASLNTPLATTPSPSANIATALAALFALLWLVTLALWWRARQRTQAPAIAPNNDSTIPMAQDAKALFQQITHACHSNDALAARHALFLWGKKQYPQINSNHELAMALDHAALTQEIAELERSIYAADTQQGWQGAALLAALKDRIAQKQSTGGKTMLLSEMNPL